VDGRVCGETAVGSYPPLFGLGIPEGLAGFSKLIVPSDFVQPGCGTPGATVTFLVDGVEAGSVAWEPGLQRIDLAVPPAPTPSPTPEIELPAAGARGASSEAWIIRWPLAAIAGLVAVVGGALVLLRRR
jgi:hypothetical protein